MGRLNHQTVSALMTLDTGLPTSRGSRAAGASHHRLTPDQRKRKVSTLNSLRMRGQAAREEGGYGNQQRGGSLRPEGFEATHKL
jgi:hypothetical protein